MRLAGNLSGVIPKCHNAHCDAQNIRANRDTSHEVTIHGQRITQVVPDITCPECGYIHRHRKGKTRGRGFIGIPIPNPTRSPGILAQAHGTATGELEPITFPSIGAEEETQPGAQSGAQPEAQEEAEDTVAPDPDLFLACDHCGAEPGELCTTPSGGTTKTHTIRLAHTDTPDPEEAQEDPEEA